MKQKITVLTLLIQQILLVTYFNRGTILGAGKGAVRQTWISDILKCSF